MHVSLPFIAKRITNPLSSDDTSWYDTMAGEQAAKKKSSLGDVEQHSQHQLKLSRASYMTFRKMKSNKSKPYSPTNYITAIFSQIKFCFGMFSSSASPAFYFTCAVKLSPLQQKSNCLPKSQPPGFYLKIAKTQSFIHSRKAEICLALQTLDSFFLPYHLILVGIFSVKSRRIPVPA